jgi:hypothetical protein
MVRLQRYFMRISQFFSVSIPGGMVIKVARGVKQAINEKLIVLAGAAVIKGMGLIRGKAELQPRLVDLQSAADD